MGLVIILSKFPANIYTGMMQHLSTDWGISWELIKTLAHASLFQWPIVLKTEYSKISFAGQHLALPLPLE